MTYPRRALKLFSLILMAFLAFWGPATAQAQEAQSIIRDAEIEATLKGWLEPLVKAAGIDAKSVHLVIVQSPEINAFVAGGMNIFIYTVLIQKTDSPGELIGVMAHELGHIAGGHLVSGREAMERASYESILGMVVGVGAALASGNGNAAVAGMGAGSAFAQANYLSHSRIKESSADQAALHFMDVAQFNPSGLVSFFEKLESEELLPADQQTPYTRTHPLTRDRIDAVELKSNTSPYKDKPWPTAWVDQHARMKAKLIGFITPTQVPWLYSDQDKSIAARYARAIAAYRTDHVKEALDDIDGLIASEPNNPYFQELKGQALVDFGRVREAIPYYRKAVDNAPEAGIIRIALGRALMESNGGPKAIKEGADEIERALDDEPRDAQARHLLATAYGQLGQETLAKLELAEEAVLQGHYPDAKMLAKGVLQAAPAGSHEARQAKDILDQVDALKKEDPRGN